MHFHFNPTIFVNILFYSSLLSFYSLIFKGESKKPLWFVFVCLCAPIFLINFLLNFFLILYPEAYSLAINSVFYFVFQIVAHVILLYGILKSEQLYKNLSLNKKTFPFRWLGFVGAFALLLALIMYPDTLTLSSQKPDLAVNAPLATIIQNYIFLFLVFLLAVPIGLWVPEKLHVYLKFILASAIIASLISILFQTRLTFTLHSTRFAIAGGMIFIVLLLQSRSLWHRDRLFSKLFYLFPAGVALFLLRPLIQTDGHPAHHEEVISDSSILEKFSKSDLDWRDGSRDFDKLKIQKPFVLVYFWADWCLPCHKMDKELFAADSFKKFVNEKNISLVHINMTETSDAKEKVAESYQIEGLPVMIIIDKNKKEIDRVTGYTSEKDTITKLRKIL